MEDLFLQLVLTLDSTFRIATPIAFAAFAGLISERSGVVDIGLEGKMLAAAFAAAAAAAVFNDTNFITQLTIWFVGQDAFNLALITDESFSQFLKISAAQIQELNQTLSNDVEFGLFSPQSIFYTLYHAAPWIGLLMAIVFSIMIALIHAFACITHKGDQIISGMAINILVIGLAPTLAHAWFKYSGRTPLLNSDGRFHPINFPFQETIGDIPVLGTIYVEFISGHNVFVYLAVLMVPLIVWLLYRSRFGLRLRAVGENPSAVDTAGISVNALRYRAVILCGALCGFAGAYLSTAQGSQFLRDMSAGKGFLALAALIFGKWKPIPTFCACLIFAFADATQARLQGVALPVIGELPSQAIEALPYILTVLLLAGFVGRSVPPKAIGIPYVKEK